MIGLSLGLGASRAGGVAIPGLTRPDLASLGETPLFLYHPHTETGVTKSGSEVTAVTGMSSPNMTKGATGPLEVTDALGRKFWRFRGSDYLEIAVGDITFTPRALTLIMVGRQPLNQNTCQFFGQSYQSDGVTQDATFTAMFQSYGVSGAAPNLRAGSVNSNATATGKTHMVVGAQMQVFGIGGRSTANGGSRFVMNSVSVNGAQSSVSYTNMKGARIGSYLKSPGTDNAFDLYAIVAVAGELSDARVDAIAALLVSAYQIPAITKQIVLDGDSIMRASNLAEEVSVASVLTDPGLELVPTSTRVFNVAASGSTVASLITRRDVAGGWPGTVLPGGAANNLLGFMIGTNDSITDSAATITSNITTYLGQATTGVLARGFNPYVGVTIAIGNTTRQAVIETLRANLRDSAFLTGLDAQAGGANEGRVSLVSLDLIEYAGSQRFNTSTHAGNATYYNSADNVHPTATGQPLLANGGSTPAYGWGAVA